MTRNMQTSNERAVRRAPRQKSTSALSAHPDPVSVAGASGPSAKNESTDANDYDAANNTPHLEDQAFSDAVARKYQQLLSFEEVAEDAEWEERVLGTALARRRQQLMCSVKNVTPVQRRLYDLPRLGKTVQFAADDALERSAHPHDAAENEAAIPEREPRPY